MDYFAVKTKSKSKKSPSKTKSKSGSKSKSASKSKSGSKSKSASKMSMVKKHKNKLLAGTGVAATLAGLGLLYKNREAVKSKMGSGIEAVKKWKMYQKLFGTAAANRMVPEAVRYDIPIDMAAGYNNTGSKYSK